MADGFVYHVLNRGNAKRVVFHKDQDYRVFIELVLEAKKRYADIKLLAYCLMPNHFHFVLKPEQGAGLSKFMQWLMTIHVRRYHEHYQSSGHLWQGRFKSFAVQEDDHLITVLRYVEGNPVRSGLTNLAGEWLWSSHRERVHGTRLLVDDAPVALPADWETYVDEPITPKELEALRASVDRQTPLGEPVWRLRAAEALGLEISSRPPGRPRKENRAQ